MRSLTGPSTLVAVVTLTMVGCSAAPMDLPVGSAPAASSSIASASASVPGTTDRKVLVIAEENHEYDRILNSPDAPYLNQLADTYGSATHLDAGYPKKCPSLAAYILLTSGSTADICDDKAPKAHRLPVDNLFAQVTASGREWRNYAETAPGPCTLTNSRNGRYLVRHVPATYYLSVRDDCARWAVPMGAPPAGPLHDDVATGTLPAFSFVSPDACHDMHGAPPCLADRVADGDRWLRSWLPQILTGPDYQAGHLTIIVTWDEGSSTTNHIPTLVISPTTSHIQADEAFTHCSTLRTIEELLGLPLLSCASSAASMLAAFRL